MDRKSLKKFPREIQDVLLDLRDQGVRHRVKDGGHVILYPQTGGRPFKVSASRPPQDTMHYLQNQFLKGNARPGGTCS